MMRYIYITSRSYTFYTYHIYMYYDDISILAYYRRFRNPKTRDDRARDVPRGQNTILRYEFVQRQTEYLLSVPKTIQYNNIRTYLRFNIRFSTRLLRLKSFYFCSIIFFFLANYIIALL